jgi:hypothetical protein
MGEIVFSTGSKENFLEDVHILARRWAENPRVVPVVGPAIKATVVEKASALFIEEGLVLALLDPPAEVLRESEAALKVLKERAGVILYFTSPGAELPASLDAVKVNLEQEGDKRIREKVLAAVKADGKKMTDKAFALLKERARDEGLLAEELAKLISYVGDRAVIGVKDVAAVVTETQHERDFIALSEAIARKNRKEVVAILDALLSQGMNTLAIHGFMTRHISPPPGQGGGRVFQRGVRFPRFLEDVPQTEGRPRSGAGREEAVSRLPEAVLRLQPRQNEPEILEGDPSFLPCHALPVRCPGEEGHATRQDGF